MLLPWLVSEAILRGVNVLTGVSTAQKPGEPQVQANTAPGGFLMKYKSLKRTPAQMHFHRQLLWPDGRTANE